jgi:hypothetical protein
LGSCLTKSTKCDQQGQGGTNLRSCLTKSTRWDQLWPGGTHVGTCFSKSTKCDQLWLRGDNLKSCLTMLTKCDLLEGGDKFVITFDQVNKKKGTEGHNWDSAPVYFCHCRKVNNGPLLDLPCRSWSPNYSVLVSF